MDGFLEVELDERANRLIEERNLSPLEAKLISCLLHPTLEKVFFEESELIFPEEGDLPNLKEVSTFLAESIKNGKKIMIHGDYDTDGIMGTTILYSGLKYLKGNVTSFIPSRIDDGYGLSERSVEEAKKTNADVVLTVDCGTNSSEIGEELKKNGIDLVVTDHHIPEFENKDWDLIVNPHFGNNDEYKSFCGATVGYVVLRQVAKYLGEDLKEEPFLRLCGIATISDVVPITPFNYLLCKKSFQDIYKSPSYGLKLLLNKCPKPPFRSYHIAYCLSPRLNSAGRIFDASLVLEILLEKEKAKAEELVKSLEEINERRKMMQNMMAEEIESHFMDEDCPFIFFASDRFHSGLIGPVASRLSYEKNKTVILIAVDGENAIGSARSTLDVDITSLLRDSDGIFTRIGGHERASGFSLKKRKIGELRDYLESKFKNYIKAEKRQKRYITLKGNEIRTVWEVLGKIDPIDHSVSPLLFAVETKDIPEPKIVCEKHYFWSIPDGRGSTIPAFYFNGIEKVKTLKNGNLLLGKLVPEKAKQKPDFFFEVNEIIY